MLASKIKKLRAEAKISQTELGRHLCVTQQAIAKWEHGLAEPSTDTILQICKFFKVSPNYLLDFDNSNSSSNVNPNIKLIARAGKKLTPQQAEDLRKYAEYMYPDAFKE